MHALQPGCQTIHDALQTYQKWLVEWRRRSPFSWTAVMGCIGQGGHQAGRGQGGAITELALKMERPLLLAGRLHACSSAKGGSMGCTPQLPGSR